MTLCKICRRGLHDQCKQGERVNSNQTSNASSRSNTPGPGKGKGKGKGGGGWNKKGGNNHTNQAKGVSDQDIRIHMLEQQVNLLCMNNAHQQMKTNTTTTNNTPTLSRAASATAIAYSDDE